MTSTDTTITIRLMHRHMDRVLYAMEVPSHWALGMRIGAVVRAALGAGIPLSGADLSGADLSRTNLSHTNLFGADLSGANLTKADLSHANLSYTNLTKANLSNADLSHANLTNVNLSGANLSYANLPNAPHTELVFAQLTVAPPEGDYIAWKKCVGDVIVKLRVPATARRSNATGRKCRAEFVDVLEVFGADYAISNYDRKTKYVAGQRVTCDAWCEDRWNECGGGIHHFMTRVEAEYYAI